MRFSGGGLLPEGLSGTLASELFDAVPLPLWVYDVETLCILAVNSAAIRHYGFTREELLGMTVADIRPAEDVARLREAIGAGSGPSYNGGEWRHRKKDGTLIDVETHAHSIEFEGRHARIVVIHDVTERKRARNVIRKLDERYRRLFRDSPDGITLTSVQGKFLAVNPAFVRMLGYDSEDEVMALDARDLFDKPEDRALYLERLRRDGKVDRHEVGLRRKDGSAITALFTARFVVDDDTGEEYLEAISEDVTELRRVERQFQQAQKMEAVGQLAGGVAHDFNNVLTVILSYSDFLLSELGENAETDREHVQAIRTAALSAATLTRQLLVFSRQQVIQPQVISINGVVEATAKMLSRLLGEKIRLTLKLDRRVGAVKIDPGLLEQIVMNLAVNARDAMPEGGTLMLTTRNVVNDGDWVRIEVTDTGCGMDEATQQRLFEPFFTTKESGKGTGLGLATVYGIVKQVGGQVAVYSEPGKGTSFKVYFPRFDADSKEPAILAPDDTPPGGTETVLLVEDQAAVRAIAREMLEKRGYRVLEASDGAGALAIATNQKERIDLLVTDVVMPGLTGRELADRFRQVRPECKVLFVSGYTGDAILHHGVLERGMQFLQKPFTSDALLRKVREAIESE
jgi:two-component system cell cycle sensor histidine kinase/response regulator CckA